jgi:hypothetical protein
VAPLLEIAMRLKSHVALDGDAAAPGTRLGGFSTALFDALGVRRATVSVVFDARGTNVPICSPVRVYGQNAYLSAMLDQTSPPASDGPI